MPQQLQALQPGVVSVCSPKQYQADLSEADAYLKEAFLEQEAQQMRGAWAVLAPIICIAILVTEILPYVSDEFPKDPLMSGMEISKVSWLGLVLAPLFLDPTRGNL